MSEDDSLEAWLAESMDAPVELLDLLPELLRDTEDLGVRAADVVAAVAEAGLGPRARVLDLGCGKGAVARALAQRYGATVEGVDGHPAFIAHGQRLAAEGGLGDRVTLAVGDLRDRIPGHRSHDLVTLLALGDVLGDGLHTLQSLTTLLRSGGHVLIDDAYLPEENDAPQALREAYGTRDDLLAQFDEAGFALIHERPVDGPEALSWYRGVLAAMCERVDELAAAHPQHAGALRAFVAQQEAQLPHLDGPVRGALFLLRSRA